MRVVPLAAHNPRPWTGAGNLTYLVGDRAPLLVDAGEGHAAHLAALRITLDGRALQRVVVTHAHPDHIGGAPAIAREHPHARFARYPWPDWPDPTGLAWDALVDDELLEVDGEALLVVHTPGHAPDHVCLFAPRQGLLFAGDLVINGGTVAIPASRGGNLRHYLHSLRRVLDLQPRRILPAHGAPIDNPSALIRAYLAHRASRERQILEILGTGPATVAALVERVYAGTAVDADAATETVLAHLLKLEEEGRVIREADTADDVGGRVALDAARAPAAAHDAARDDAPAAAAGTPHDHAPAPARSSRWRLT